MKYANNITKLFMIKILIRNFNIKFNINHQKKINKNLINNKKNTCKINQKNMTYV